MRIVVFCATFAAIAFPSMAGAQSLPLTESDALARLSVDSPRVRDARRDRHRAGRRVDGRAVAKPARHLRSRVGRGSLCRRW